uniref:Uncharacterized protein n=1 Tax=Ditylenchus dipsaci TaxID=166011 RepID=A0A915D6L8_9BILA
MPSIPQFEGSFASELPNIEERESERVVSANASRQLNVDERKLIQFGVYYGFVRKLLVYPIANDSKDETTKIVLQIIQFYFQPCRNALLLLEKFISLESAYRTELKGINYTQQAVNLLHHQQNTEEIRQKLPFDCCLV